MDDALRLRYLSAMGIDVWQMRRASVPMVQINETPVNSVDRASESIAVTPPMQLKPTSDDWQTLQTQVASCTRCGLCQTRQHTVFGEGNPNADWLFIGEAPGQQEDLQGQPFVGPAGQLLTEMLRAMGLVREQIFMTNVIKCRPPNNRDPHVEEMTHCRDYLQQQIASIQPKIIIAVGRVAAQALLNSPDTLGQLRGKVHRYQAIPLMVIYHPAYLLRSLLAKRTAWQDLQVILQQTRALGL